MNRTIQKHANEIIRLTLRHDEEGRSDFEKNEILDNIFQLAYKIKNINSKESKK